MVVYIYPQKTGSGTKNLDSTDYAFKQVQSYNNYATSGNEELMLTMKLRIIAYIQNHKLKIYPLLITLPLIQKYNNLKQ